MIRVVERVRVAHEAYARARVLGAPRFEVPRKLVLLRALDSRAFVKKQLLRSRQLREVLAGNVDVHRAGHLDRPRVLFDVIDEHLSLRRRLRVLRHDG